MTTPTRAQLRQVMLARARVALSSLPDQLAAAIVAMPPPRTREAIERKLMAAIEARLAEMEASPPTPAELAQIVH